MKMGAWSPLAVDRVRYVGDAVVIVVADTKGQARDAAEAVEITYKELPAVTDASKALEPGAPQLHPEADEQSDLRLGDRRRRRRPTRRSPRPRMSPSMDIVNNRLVPERDGAARRARPLRQGARTTTPAGRPRRTRMSRGW